MSNNDKDRIYGNMRMIAVAIKNGRISVASTAEKGMMYEDSHIALGAFDFVGRCARALSDFRDAGGTAVEAKDLFSRLFVEGK